MNINQATWSRGTNHFRKLEFLKFMTALFLNFLKTWKIWKLVFIKITLEATLLKIDTKSTHNIFFYRGRIFKFYGKLIIYL
jgi:hypothetical protein